MSVRRALLDCAVLRVQDNCVFYPCCKGCFSRIDVEPQDTRRCRCSRCGYTCLREQVEHRYRLCLRVTRDRAIFGVTVFGTCLNQYFGIHASGLQRLVENSHGPVEASTKAKLLVKAVEDCFTGRHFIFGIKVPGTNAELPFGNSDLSTDRVQFIASQMILPKAAGLGGFTVLSYYQLLLQKPAESHLESSDPNKTRRTTEMPLLLISHCSPPRSFNNTFSASRFLSLSPLRSQDCSVIATPPWQQSMGLVTSSAEQDEGHNESREENEDESFRQTGVNKTCPAQNNSPEKETVTEEITFSPAPSSEQSPFSPDDHLHGSIDEAVGNGRLAKIWVSPFQPDHQDSSLRNMEKVLSSSQKNPKSGSSSLVWEDLPFSESLSEFLCEEYNGFDDGEPRHNVPNQNKVVQKAQEAKSQIKDESRKNESSAHVSENLLRERCGLSERNYTFDCNQEVKESTSLSFVNKEEQLEEDIYDCSADLFASSPVIKYINTPAQSLKVSTEAFLPLSSSEQHKLMSKNSKIPQLTPDNPKSKTNKSSFRDSLVALGVTDFIPPAQSTPLLKTKAVSASSLSSHRRSQADTQVMCFFNSDQQPHCNSESNKENLALNTTSFRHDHSITPKRRVFKANRQKCHSVSRQTPGRTNQSDSSVCDVTACCREDSEVIVPPTPVAKTGVSEKHRRIKRRQTNHECSGSVRGQQMHQEHGMNCKRNLLDFQPTSASAQERELTRTGNCGVMSSDDGSLNGSHLCGDDNQACDWSRDLFSDST